MTTSRPPRPNILFAFADDWGRYASAYRQVEGDGTPNALIQTPNFDRVAREGVLFTNALVPAPSCTPCRSAILAGRYFWQTGLGAILECAEWDATIPSYPLLLEQAGYHTGFTYKVWSPGTPRDAPHGGARAGYHPGGSRFGRFSHYVTERAPDVGVAAAKQELYSEVRQNLDAFLAARPPGQPFCYWWGPTNTHRTWERGSGQALWGLDPGALHGRLPGFLPDVPAVREDVCDYLGECLAVDAGLGVILARLEAIGELDNTLVVVSGDHGVPGLPRGKCNLYDIGCEVALAARWPGHIQPGRVVDDLVNLMDLGPTFLDVAGETPPACMDAVSLRGVLESRASGQVDPARTFVVTGRERHVARAREGNLPYPQRAIRTHDFLYIRNFAPDRWPVGDPRGLDDLQAAPPSYEELCSNTHVAFADMDASPTKAWMIHHRAEERCRGPFEIGFGRRPAEELYDLCADPDHLHNVAGDPAHADTRRRLAAQLTQELKAHGDPRVTGPDCCYERLPFTAVP